VVKIVWLTKKSKLVKSHKCLTKELNNGRNKHPGERPY